MELPIGALLCESRGAPLCVIIQAFSEAISLIVKRGALKSYNLMRDAQYAIAKMELAGAPFDAAEHERLITQWGEQRGLAEECLRDDTGFGQVNLNSGKQISS